MSHVPSFEVQERILYECEKELSSCIVTLKDDFDTRSSFDRAVLRLDMTSSPGYPYSYEATTNGQWLKWNGVFCDPIQLERLWYDVKLVLSDQWQHVLKTFIKQEPHKKSKVDEKRWRLIMASSLCVQLAWHMLFDDLNDKEIEKSYIIPPQQGIVLPSGGWRLYYDSWKQRGLSHGVDKSAWDWTAPFWAIMLDLDLRFRLLRGSRKKEWLLVAKILYRHMFEDPCILTSNGCLYRQIVPGIMKSGCVSTISINGHCQLFLHIASCLEAGISIFPFPRCCGDDTINHQKHCHLSPYYARFGVIVKSVSNDIEFVGHRFDIDGPKPLYVDKHIKRLLYVPDDILPGFLDSMSRMYVKSSLFGFWESLANDLVGGLPLSHKAINYWYDHAV